MAKGINIVSSLMIQVVIVVTQIFKKLKLNVIQQLYALIPFQVQYPNRFKFLTMHSRHKFNRNSIQVVVVNKILQSANNPLFIL